MQDIDDHGVVADDESKGEDAFAVTGDADGDDQPEPEHAKSKWEKELEDNLEEVVDLTCELCEGVFCYVPRLLAMTYDLGLRVSTCHIVVDLL